MESGSAKPRGRTVVAKPGSRELSGLNAIAIAAGVAAVCLHETQALHGEFLLFAAFWMAAGAVDEFMVDLAWLVLLLTGRARSGRLPRYFAGRPLSGIFAVFVPAWHEAAVIGVTIRHALAAWPQPELRLYVGCYANDPATAAAVRAAAGSDPRVRLVIHRSTGPTTKGDCLNRLHRALSRDERSGGWRARMVIFHDAEDMVHPAEPAVFDAALDQVDFVQLPVRAEPVAASRWIAGHYLDEFAEAHAKTMVVRDALGAAIPAAGVGFAVRREVLGDGADPFAADCLTEDYLFGLDLHRNGWTGRFLRLRDSSGALVATRSCFPHDLGAAIRQKARWIEGIACQGWDRIGWFGGLANRWMLLRDRRSPLIALVLASAYLALASGAPLVASEHAHWVAGRRQASFMPLLVDLCLLAVAVRTLLRAVFTGREYGPGEALWAVLRIPVANLIAIAATRQALWNYLRTLSSGRMVWDKTEHSHHPAETGGTRELRNAR